MELLEAHGIAGEPTALSPWVPEAVRALSHGEVDAVFIVSGVESGAVWTAFTRRT
jgi:TRAP-type uncharacterized transport system substrate-binding protein